MCFTKQKPEAKIAIFFLLYAASTTVLINLVQIIVEHIRVKFTKVPLE